MRRQDQGLWIGLGLLLVVLVAMPMLGSGMMASGMMGWYGLTTDAVGWMWPIGWLAMVLLWAAIVALVVLAFRRLNSSADDTRTELPEPPAEILKRRYAVGDTSREQFDKMQHVLQSGS